MADVEKEEVYESHGVLDTEHSLPAVRDWTKAWVKQEIEKLDSSAVAREDHALISVTITDGKISDFKDVSLNTKVQAADDYALTGITVKNGQIVGYNEVLLNSSVEASAGNVLSGITIKNGKIVDHKEFNITKLYRFRGSVPTQADLPTRGMIDGDVYSIVARSDYGMPNQNVAWASDHWDPLGPTLTIDPLVLKIGKADIEGTNYFTYSGENKTVVLGNVSLINTDNNADSFLRGDGTWGTFSTMVTGTKVTSAVGADKLNTVRHINNTSFDGTGDITTNVWGYSRNFTIKDSTFANAGAVMPVDGGTDVTLTLPSTIEANITGTSLRATNDADGNLISDTYLKRSGGTMTGQLVVDVQGKPAVFGGSASYISETVYNPTAGIIIDAGDGSTTGSTAIGFHNPNISSAVLEYKNTDANHGQFIFNSDDTDWSVTAPRFTFDKLTYNWTSGKNVPMVELKDAPGFGINYHEGDQDRMIFSVSGNSNDSTNADFVIGGASSYIRGNRIVTVAGDTMNDTAQIRRNGNSVSWIGGRDGAIVRQISYNGYNPIISTKTTNGSWELGPYTDDNLHISYISDANYNAGNNAQTVDFCIHPDGSLSGVTLPWGSVSGKPTFYQNDRGYINRNTDYNSLTAAGSYKVQDSAWGDAGTKHGPNNLNGSLYTYGILMVYKAPEDDSEHRLVQVYMPHNTGANSWCFRWHNGADYSIGWSGWQWLSTDTDKSANYLPLSGGTMSGDIAFAATGTTGTSSRITFSGSTDGAQIYYNVPASDQGNLVLNMTDDANAYIQFACNGAVHSYISPADGVYHGSADMVDGYHENSFLRYRGTTSTNAEGTYWSQIGIKQYNGALPSGLSGLYNWGAVVSLPGNDSRLDIFYNHQSSVNGNGLCYRTGWGSDAKAWATLVDSVNFNNFGTTTNTANTVVKRDGNGYIYAQYYNQASGVETPNSSSYVIYANSDGWFRKSYIGNILASGYAMVSAERTGTLTNLISQVRYTSGGAGSVSLTASYGIPAGWYNYLYMPHRVGTGSGDNGDYGTLLLYPMTWDGVGYRVRQNNGNPVGVTTLWDTNSLSACSDADINTCINMFS